MAVDAPADPLRVRSVGACSLTHTLVSLAAATTLIGCPPAAASKPPAAESMAGFVRHQHNKWVFVPCTPTTQRGKPNKLARASGQPFVDGSRDGAMFRAIQQRWQQSVDPRRGVYVEFSGYQENGRTTAIDFQRALGWVDRCENRPENIPPSARLWASGHEPNWRLVYDGAAGHQQVLGGPRLELRNLRHQRREGVDEWVGEDIRIEASVELCTDTMAEASFGRRVTARVRGRLLQGCGVAR